MQRSVVRSYRNVLPSFELPPNYRLPLRYIYVPSIDYAAGLSLQQGLVDRRIEARRKLATNPNDDKALDIAMTDIVLFVQHTPTYTFGRRQKKSDIPPGLDKIASVHITNRGGQTTFHGPGQLTAYPILDLTLHKLSARCYVDKLEQTLIRTMGEYDISASRKDTGIWASGKKIASIGIHIQRHVTSHGFALNCTTDLSYYDHIEACGIPGGSKMVTSLSQEANRSISPDEALPIIAQAFGDIFDRRMVRIGPGNDKEQDQELF